MPVYPYPPLELILAMLNVPLLPCLSDSDAHIKAAETAVGIFEMDTFRCALEREQLMPFVQWVGGGKEMPQPRLDQDLFSLEQGRNR